MVRDPQLAPTPKALQSDEVQKKLVEVVKDKLSGGQLTMYPDIGKLTDAHLVLVVREATAIYNALTIAIPRVIAASEPVGEQPAFLIIEYLEPARPGAVPDDEKLGRGLATIHRTAAGRFGFESRTYCGLTPQDNRWRDSWVEFFRDQRLQPLVDALSRDRALPSADQRLYERLMARLPDLLPSRSPVSLIHGDLWSGNVLFRARGPALVDPACAYADREMEFGITTLFGGLSPRAYRAYEEAWPLPGGWRDRNPLYQLYHLLNHAVLFGGSYGEDARRIAARYAG